VDNPPLDAPRPQGGNAAYAVFGKVIGGMDNVDRIRNTPVKEHPKLPMGPVVPVETVEIKKASKLTADEAKAAAKAADEAGKKFAADAKSAGEKTLTDRLAQIEKETGKKPEKTPNGIYHVVLKEGSGASPRAVDQVKVNYKGTLLNGKQFDASKEPVQFPLNGVIKGWTESLTLMKPGEKRVIVIPPDLAYGPASPPGSNIPPNSWLVFEVELLEVVGR
jgi:FKBP-type peptidyl-prolyl cis-trans isomerase